jgi:hypothetical protein
MADGNTEQPAARQQGGLLSGLFRMAMMWYFFKQFTGSKKGGDPKDTVFLEPTMEKGTPLDVHFWITDDAQFPQTWQFAAAHLEPALSFSNVPVASSEPRVVKYVYRPSDNAKTNGSVSVHAVFTRHGNSFDPEDTSFDQASTWGFSKQLTTYLEKVGGKSGVKLLKSGEESEESRQEQLPVLNYLKPNVTVSFVDDFSKINAKQVAPHMMNILNRVDETHYTPHVYWNEFWILRDYLVPLNETVAEQTIFFSVETLSALKAQMMLSMDNSFALQEQWGMSSSGESDEVKRIFLEGNPYFLALTVAVSMLHSLLDVLAFKSDIGFWKDNKSMKGLSARSIMLNAFCQLVISLYLWDNETSTVVLISSFVGTAIEFWKVTKAMDVSVVAKFPYVSVKDRATYVESETDKWDREAMKYLGWVLYPLVAGYSVYALMYETHKSWYSWILSSLVGAVYCFGFLSLCPQLYLNYKLKSVAHLPAKQYMYKFLNTIIDDMFAFVIKMPILHRLAVFRDDIVFVVYLYQRWIYRVDKTRVNEFGYCEDADDSAKNMSGEKEKNMSGEREKNMSGEREKSSVSQGQEEDDKEGKKDK